ncbi:MAG TPA: histidine phosphatase family protein [Candidatus Dormibacteraeota bacterium]|nr:histidine phosphatase family protein [Candidatus Dormibacteraeota bacterium]
MAGPRRLWLVRHGETTWNVAGRYQGRKDSMLSGRGVAQAHALAERLAHDPPAAIVASPLLRTRATADAVAQRLDLRVEADERLIEISHGEWEGYTRAEVEERWPETLALWKRAPHEVRFPGGETLGDVWARWADFVADPPAAASPLLVVTHDVIVRLAILAAQGKGPEGYHEISVENAALNELVLDDGRVRVLRVNDAAHLDGLRADVASQAS